jgi:hypothetical protein
MPSCCATPNRVFAGLRASDGGEWLERVVDAPVSAGTLLGVQSFTFQEALASAINGTGKILQLMLNVLQLTELHVPCPT